jgi:DNA-directed RNA polymerase beta subunit
MSSSEEEGSYPYDIDDSDGEIGDVQFDEDIIEGDSPEGDDLGSVNLEEAEGDLENITLHVPVESDLAKRKKQEQLDVSIDEKFGIKDVMERGIFPPPITKIIEVVDDIRSADVPGEITISQDGQLLRSYLAYEGFLNDSIEAYDNAILKGLPANLQSREIKLPNGNVIRFLKLYYTRPSEDELNPLIAREQNMTYDAEISADMAEFDENGNILPGDDHMKRVRLGRLPIMLGSVLDVNRGKTATERSQAGECISDPQGYFIIGGNEYLILLRDQLRFNRIFTTGKKDSIRCNMTCKTKIGTILVDLYNENKGTNNLKNTIMIGLQFLRQELINVYIVYYLLGVEDPNVILNMILLHIKPKNKAKVRSRLAMTMVDFMGLDPDSSTQIGMGAVLTIAKILNESVELVKEGEVDIGSTLVYQELKDKYIRNIKQYLFPQIPATDVTNKLHMLSIMIGRYTETLLGLRTIDNRDSWSNKRILSAGPRIFQLFGRCIQKVISKMHGYKGILTTMGSSKDKSRSSYFREVSGKFIDSITDDFRSSFTTKWGCRGSDKRDEGVTELVSRLSILDIYSHSTQIKTKTDTKTKNTKVREIDMTQTGYVDAVYSPEGGNCGIVKAKSVTCWISIDRGIDDTLSFLNGSTDKDRLIHNEYSVGSNICILNGRLLGWCSGRDLRDKLVARRRRGIHKDIMVVLDPDGILWIDSGDQRPTRPLLVVNEETGHLVIDEKDLWGKDFGDLLSEGAIEYIDAWEQEYSLLYQRIDDIVAKQNEMLVILDDIDFARVQLESLTGTRRNVSIGDKLLEDIKVGQTSIDDRHNFEKQRIRREIETSKYKLTQLEGIAKSYTSDVVDIMIEETIQQRHQELEEGWIEIATLRKGFDERVGRMTVMAEEIGEMPLSSQKLEKSREFEEIKRIYEADAEIFTRYRSFMERPDKNEIIQRESHDHVNNIIVQSQHNVEEKKREIAMLYERYGSFETVDENPIIEPDQSMTEDEAEDQLQNATRALRRLYARGTYTHCELDPNAILGIAASIIPLSNHNQAPRNTYQCLVAGTGILRPNGKSTPIEELRNGDEVITVDPNTHRKSITKIKNHFEIESGANGKKVLEIETYSGRKIQATSDHQFLTFNGWVDAGDLDTSIHHLVISPTFKDNCILEVIRSIKTVDHCMVYDFETESDNHSFIADGFVTHNCNMGRQSLGIYNSAHTYRFDTTAKLLQYPSRPLFETQMYDILGLNNLPAGNMVILAIATYDGNNQEDALVFKKGAIERGLFMMTVYHSITTTYRPSGHIRKSQAREILGIPDANVRRNVPGIYHALGPDGIAQIDSKIKAGDCLVGKTRLIDGKAEDASTYATMDQTGTVDRIMHSGKNHIIKIKVRQLRTPQKGDKFASRHAQKSTIGMIVNDEDMPFTRNGMSPDLIMNPHAIPSRMTLGQILEIVTSKHGALAGERVNATSYNNFDVDEFRRSLSQYGFNSDGYETMIDGRTGKEFKAQIFIGPCYYQALKHNVEDKIQSRSVGSIDAMTRQPVGGRVRKGGQRLGEMEQDAIISHGAGAIINERFCISSDAYKSVYCATCGTAAVSSIDRKKYSCRSCQSNNFGTCTVPHPFRSLGNLLGGANIKMTVGLQEKSEG